MNTACKRGVLRLRSASASFRSELVTFLIFSTPVMLSGSAAQAAVESKHPRSACHATTVDTFFVHNLSPTVP